MHMLQDLKRLIFGIIFAVNKLTLHLLNNHDCMKNLALFLILALIAFSCQKSTDTFKPIDIQAELNDDVSPLVGEFSIPGEFDYIEWTFEEKYPSEFSPNPAFHLFVDKGKTTVRVTAYRNETREKFSGMKEIVIPDVAKKIKIKGLFFLNLQGPNPLDQKSLLVALNYGTPEKNNRKYFSFSPSSLSPSDTLFFAEPIIYDIEGFLDGESNDDILYLSISEKLTNNLSFNSFTHLKSEYMATHPWCPNWIHCMNNTTNDFKQISLLTDFMLE
jgi:hypothetical protein